MSNKILNTSDEAATYKTNISGWVSRHGRYFGADERTARYDGCTHLVCETCGAVIVKGRAWCDRCFAAKRDKVYAGMKREKWDGKTPVCIFDSDEYFFDDDDIEEYCQENEVKRADLRLVICVPVYGRMIDVDFYADELPEDGELPDAVLKAMDALNAAVHAAGPLSWRQGNVAVDGAAGKAGEG